MKPEIDGSYEDKKLCTMFTGQTTSYPNPYRKGAWVPSIHEVNNVSRQTR